MAFSELRDGALYGMLTASRMMAAVASSKMRLTNNAMLISHSVAGQRNMKDPSNVAPDLWTRAPGSITMPVVALSPVTMNATEASL